MVVLDNRSPGASLTDLLFGHPHQDERRLELRELRMRIPLSATVHVKSQCCKVFRSSNARHVEYESKQRLTAGFVGGANTSLIEHAPEPVPAVTGRHHHSTEKANRLRRR